MNKNNINNPPLYRTTIGGRPAIEWHTTIMLARVHSIAWIMLVPTLCLFLYLAWRCYRWQNYGGALFGASISGLLLWINFVGFHAIWLCKRNRIDWCRNWNKQSASCDESGRGH
jgi:hypothetical protein